MNIKIDNMIDLRAFCLEQAVKRQEYEKYILGGISLPDQPFNSDKLLYDTMTYIIKNKEENDVKKQLD